MYFGSSTSIKSLNIQNLRKALVVISAASVIAGCSREAANAEREYEIAKESGAGLAELCRRGKDVAEAYLKAQDQRKYLEWSVNANTSCLEADLLRHNYY